MNYNDSEATMPGVDAFLGFVAVAALTVLLPGPDTFVVLRTTLAEGPRAGTLAAAGSGAGNLVWGTATVVGVAGLLAASSVAFGALKLAGAAYLVVLGVQALAAAARGDRLVSEGDAAVDPSLTAAFRRGLASDLLNVKVGLFWTALVPQFVSPDSTALLPAAMVVTMGGLVFVWLAAYARLAAGLSRTLTRRGTSVALNAAVGVVLVALGASLGLAHP